ncbi:hypothetical protein Acr_09g0005210 [Actinidia rufa]|uniref:Uncharacterized protein n=1 Tax=Actinidia rufa TaxID=165716 RepID=A0A7J0F5U5_9ERIC|nr:hypothetical protein Acr_09g0005210 [Actinidia rufa]
MFNFAKNLRVRGRRRERVFRHGRLFAQMEMKISVSEGGSGSNEQNLAEISDVGKSNETPVDVNGEKLVTEEDENVCAKSTAQTEVTSVGKPVMKRKKSVPTNSRKVMGRGIRIRSDENNSGTGGGGGEDWIRHLVEMMRILVMGLLEELRSELGATLESSMLSEWTMSMWFCKMVFDMGNAIGRCILGFEMDICLLVHTVRGLDGIANGKVDGMAVGN